MTTLTQDFQAILAALAPAGNVHYGLNLSPPTVYPYIVWHRVTSTPNVSMRGPSDLQNTRVQVDIYSLILAEAQTIEIALESAMAACAITNAPLLSFDLVDPDTRSYRIVKEFSLWARN